MTSDDIPNLLNDLFFGAHEQCESSLDDLDLLDKVFLRIIMYQVCLNTFLPVNSNKSCQLKHTDHFMA